MSVEDVQVSGSLTPQARARDVSQTLSEAARKARFSTRSRKGVGGGFRARRGQRLFTIGVRLAFILLVVLPSLAAVVYYGLIASDQFVSEARFSVRTGQMAGMDPLTSISGIPSIQIIQDTLVVSNYIHSRPLLERLQREVDFDKLYSSPDSDVVARLKPNRPVEKILDYWKGVSDVSIQSQGGIITLSVRAFHAEDAQRVAKAVIQASENLVNQMNDRVRQDAVTMAEADLQEAAKRLTVANTALEEARNREGVLDATVTADTLNGLIAAVRGEQLKLQQQYETIRRTLSTDAPQIRDLKARIAAADRQMGDIRSQLTQAQAGGNKAVLSATMTTLAALDLDRQVAESQYTSASNSVERARIASQVKQIYLTTFVEPTLPDEATYPRRLWSSSVVFGVGLLAWCAAFGLATLARNHMA